VQAVKINGKPVATASIAEHLEPGWQKIKIEPSSLKKGGNVIELMTTDSLSYVYFGVDKDSNFGKSLYSRKRGKHFEEVKGECMIRLILKITEAL
jgi:hypothetical protein